jgi:hypothetical protein
LHTRTLPATPRDEPDTRTHRRAAAASQPPRQPQPDTTVPDPRMVFAKTEAGSEAVRTATRQLSLPARRLLMLLDGQRSLSQLPSIVRPDDVPTLLRELEAQGMITLTGMNDSDESANRMHPDLKMAQIKRSLAGVFERELGQQASVLEARVQDCVNLLVLRSVLREVITLVGQRKNADAADRIAAIVKKHGPF